MAVVLFLLLRRFFGTVLLSILGMLNHCTLNLLITQHNAITIFSLAN